MITAALGLDISDFQSKLSKAGAEVAKVGKRSGIGALGAGFAAAAAVVAAAAAAVGVAATGMYKAMEAGGELIDLQEQTGIAVEKLMALQVGFEMAGLAASDVQPVINKMQKALAEAAGGNAQAAASFQGLGLSIFELAAMSPEKQLAAVGDAIAKIENPTRKALAAMEIFGKSGGKMLALFAAGGLDDATAALGNQARLMAENAGIFDKITDTFGTAATKLQGFFVGMASAVAPQLLAAVDAFQNIDLSGLGEQIGNVVAVFLQAIQSGDAWSAVGEALSAAFIFAINTSFELMRAQIAASGQLFIELFRIVTTADFWGGLLTVLVGIAQKFGATLLSFIPGMKATAKEMEQRSKENLEAGTPALEGALDVKGVLQRTRQTAAANFDLGADLSQLKEKLGATFGKFGEEASKTAEAAKSALATPIPGAGVLNVVPTIKTAGEGLASSLAKIGGTAGGGGANPQLDQMRVQTNALQGMLGKLDQLIANTASDGALNGGSGAYVLA